VVNGFRGRGGGGGSKSWGKDMWHGYFLGKLLF
jgi:hypothetical protein